MFATMAAAVALAAVTGMALMQGKVFDKWLHQWDVWFFCEENIFHVVRGGGC